MRAAVNIGRAPRPEIPNAALLLDFANGAYRKDGVTDTLAALGGTTSGAPSINSSGLLCSTSGQSVQIPYTYSGEFLVRLVTEGDAGGVSLSTAVNWIDTDGTARARAYKNGSSLTATVVSNTSSGTQQTYPLSTTKLVFGYTNSAWRASASGSTPVVTPFAAPFSFNPGQVVVGNVSAGGSEPWGSKRIRSVEIFLGNFPDDLIQDLSL